MENVVIICENIGGHKKSDAKGEYYFEILPSRNAGAETP